MPRRRTHRRRRSLRQGRRVRASNIVNLKLVNTQSNSAHINISTGALESQNIGPRLVSADVSSTGTIQFGSTYYQSFSMLDIYNNSTEQTQLKNLFTSFLLYRLNAIKFTLTPRTSASRPYPLTQADYEGTHYPLSSIRGPNARGVILPYSGIMSPITNIDIRSDGDNTKKLLDYPGARSFNLQHGVSYYFRPHVDEVTTTGISSQGIAGYIGYGHDPPPWIDTAFDITQIPAVKHYGIILAFPSADPVLYDVTYTYYVSFKDVR